MTENNSKIKAGLVGLCVGDALGLPAKSQYREYIENNPIITMQGGGTHDQKPGTWSDSSSLTFCLAEALCITREPEEILEITARKFCDWYFMGYWTAHGKPIDLAFTTGQAIYNLSKGKPPTEAGNKTDGNNSNGALMRLLPLVFCHSFFEFDELIKLTYDVSSITHGHEINLMGCGLYMSIALSLFEGNPPEKAYREGIQRVKERYKEPPFVSERKEYQRIIDGQLGGLNVDDIKSHAYIVSTLEAALWCLLNTDNYRDAVLKAVNLAEDADHVASITGGLAGIYYGFESIPTDWINQLAKKNNILDLAHRLEVAINSKS